MIDLEEDDLALDEAALLIAAHAYPDFDVDSWLYRLDDLAAMCAHDASTRGVVHSLFVDQGFAGNVEAYGDPRNSMLNEVIDRRVGIPITLSVLLIEVARRLGVRLHGVGMPGHFLVGVDEEPGMFVDPFYGGEYLDADGCCVRFEALQGPNAAWSSAYLAPTGTRAILLRMLNNLAQSYGSGRGAAWVCRLRLGFVELPVAERRRTALVLGSTGAFAEASGVLDTLADSLSGDIAEEVRAQAVSLRARAN